MGRQSRPSQGQRSGISRGDWERARPPLFPRLSRGDSEHAKRERSGWLPGDDRPHLQRKKNGTIWVLTAQAIPHARHVGDLKQHWETAGETVKTGYT
ncbi:hypothetical protein QYE77_08735 [Thermanaerothrix sp. 4228-RoL]|uniref:Uncharacterized protein n=1 Tax=Thermanaerothrix solaris TaxID=3058434 RepID=A0ABU3NNC5_9CHLR|nr:hypothetical protein [Thermanaerothrix sp. 4228-RoL]